MSPSVETYLTTLLTKIELPELRADQQKHWQRDPASLITDTLMRRTFRRSISDETLAKTKQKVVDSLQAEKPLHLVVPFGGYKHYWNASQPEPDWAEVFHLRWMTEYVLPILALYQPGIIIEYMSEDLILPRMNNYPEAALEDYSAAFRQLLDWFMPQLPKNFEFRFRRVGEICDKQAIIDQVESLLPERRRAFDQLGPEAQEQEIHRSQRSVYWQGKQDLSHLDEPSRRQRIIESRLIELAFYDTEGSPEFMGDYYWRDNHIPVCFSFGLSPDNAAFGDLTLQTAPGSIVDFWIGHGLIKRLGQKMFGTIVSRQQYAQVQEHLELVKLESKLVPLKHCQSIEVITTAAA